METGLGNFFELLTGSLGADRIWAYGRAERMAYGFGLRVWGGCCDSTSTSASCCSGNPFANEGYDAYSTSGYLLDCKDDGGNRIAQFLVRNEFVVCAFGNSCYDNSCNIYPA